MSVVVVLVLQFFSLPVDGCVLSSSASVNCRTRQDATDPKQKAVTDYEEQVNRHPPPLHRKTKKQDNQYNHNGHNNQEPNQ